MRNRDGNNSFSRFFCSIIFFASLALHASEYLISYRYVVKDTILYNETLDISHAMTKCTGTPSNEIILFSKSKKSLKEIIADNQDEFIDYIHKLGLHLDHQEKTIDFQNSSTTILTLKTTCFKVDFNENLARISALK